MSIVSALRISHVPARAFVIIGLFWGTFAAHVPEIKANIGAGDALFGTLLLSTSIGLLTSMWLAPRLDRWLGGRGMQFGAVLLAVTFVLPALASTPLQFALSLVALGSASGLLDVTMNARVSELEARHSRTLMNANHGIFSVGYAISALMSGFTREAGIPPEITFACVAAVVVFLAFGLQMDVEIVDEPEGEKAAYPLAPILLCGVLVMIAFMSEATVESWSALHIERTLGGRAAEGALGPATLGIMMAIGRFSGQAVSDRMSDLTVILIATLMAATGAVIAGFAQVPWVAYVGFGILGLGVSVIGPLGLALVGRMVPRHLRTEAIARAAVMGFSGFFVAPVLMGVASEAFGLGWAFVMVAGFVLLILPLLGPIRARLGQPVAKVA